MFAAGIGRGMGVAKRVVWREGVGEVDVEEDVDEEEEEEGDRVEDEDVRDVGYAGVGEEVHLFFCGTHEEETGSIEELKEC